MQRRPRNGAGDMTMSISPRSYAPTLLDPVKDLCRQRHAQNAAAQVMDRSTQKMITAARANDAREAERFRND